MAQHRPNLQFDILPTVTFVTIAAASLSAQRPLPAVVVRFVRALRTTCSRGSGPPVDQRGQVFTWAAVDPQDRYRDRQRRQSSTSSATTSLPEAFGWQVVQTADGPDFIRVIDN
jgi:hypothetical protein